MQAKDLRAGATIMLNGDINIVIDYRYYSPGNKRAFVQVTIQSMRTGSTVQKKFSSTEDVEDVTLDSRKCQYLYHDQEGYHFMDLEDYHSFPLNEKTIGDKKFYLKDNDEITIEFHEGNPVRIEMPNHVFLKVTESPPWVKGDSVSNNMKPAVAETGLKIQVPMFLKEGEIIKVDTRTGEYLGRK
jgi:elongation factor P